MWKRGWKRRKRSGSFFLSWLVTGSSLLSRCPQAGPCFCVGSLITEVPIPVTPPLHRCHPDPFPSLLPVHGMWLEQGRDAGGESMPGSCFLGGVEDRILCAPAQIFSMIASSRAILSFPSLAHGSPAARESPAGAALSTGKEVFPS